MDKHQHTVKMFSEHVSEYVDRFMSLGLYKDTFEEFATMLPKKATILELGCGPGNVVKFLRSIRNDLDILGIDLAPGMIEEAKKQNAGVRFELMDIREIGQLKQQFDAVIAAFCLPYISYDDVPALFKDIRDLTTDNALVYVSFMQGPRERSGFEKTSFTGDKEIYINYHDASEIERLLNKNGFFVKTSFSKDYPEQVPQEDDRNELDAELSLQCFALAELERNVCSEVIELHLHGGRSQAPASIVLPLLLPDLPAFLRWRGQPGFGEGAFEQLVDVVDRLVVDSREWPDAPGCYPRLAEYFERVAVSDIVWTRTLRWRRTIARLWPGVAEVDELHVVGPEQEATLLVGWLRSRLERRVELRHEAADRIELLELDGSEVRAREDRWSPSDLLSHELDRFSRDPIYESAVVAGAA